MLEKLDQQQQKFTKKLIYLGGGGRPVETEGPDNTEFIWKFGNAGVQEKMLLKSANFFLHTDMDM